MDNIHHWPMFRWDAENGGGVKRTLIDSDTGCPIIGPAQRGFRAMGYNARNDEIRDNVTRMRQAWAAHRH
jgi:hypothetical protein